MTNGCRRRFMKGHTLPPGRGLLPHGRIDALAGPVHRKIRGEHRRSRLLPPRLRELPRIEAVETEFVEHVDDGLLRGPVVAGDRGRDPSRIPRRTRAIASALAAARAPISSAN
jgi:hypothetical protein